MNGLVLVAASGLAREVLAVERLLDRFDTIALVDDNPELWGTTLGGHPVLGGIDTAAGLDSRLLVCAGRGAARRAIVERLAALGVGPDRYTTLIHPNVRVPACCRVDSGSILLGGVVLTADVQVGAHVVAMPHVTLTHDDVVEDFSTLCAGVTLGGNVRVGSGAYLGMSSSVRENVTVGSDALLGMGAALLEDLPPGQTWVGMPARPMAALVPSGVRREMKEEL